MPPNPGALFTWDAPAQNWSAGLNGDLRLGNGQRYCLFTLTDDHSCFILQCRALSRTTTESVNRWFERVFSEYGLPEMRRADYEARLEVSREFRHGRVSIVNTYCGSGR